MSDPIHILGLGAGVQSSTEALMAEAGEITPKPTAAIFADTKAEPKSVYDWLDWLEGQLSFPVYRVTAGSLTEAITTAHFNAKTRRNYLSQKVPFFVKGDTDGMLYRDCTKDFKINPITRKVKELAQIHRGEKSIKAILWFGISLDETHRMKPSRDMAIQHRWPLIEARMTRHDCIRWMKAHGFPKPPRSACVYCPYHSDNEWRRLRNEEPEAFAEAVRVEKRVQMLHRGPTDKGRINGVPYLHRSLRPLDKVDFSTDEDHGQQVMFGNECEGMCNV